VIRWTSGRNFPKTLCLDFGAVGDKPSHKNSATRPQEPATRLQKPGHPATRTRPPGHENPATVRPGHPATKTQPPDTKPGHPATRIRPLRHKTRPPGHKNPATRPQDPATRPRKNPATRPQDRFTNHVTHCTLGILWGGFGVTLEALWGYFGVNLGILWGHFGFSLGILWGHFGVACPATGNQVDGLPPVWNLLVLGKSCRVQGSV
jgi:hypothetical protein